MWCCHCRCEVAVEPSAGAPRCADCQAALPDAETASTSVESSAAARALAAPAVQHLREDLELADDLRRARRLLRVDRAGSDRQPVELTVLLADEPASGGSAKRNRRRHASRRRQAGVSWKTRLWGAATWLIVCSGGMGLTFGAALLASTQLLHTHFFREGLARRDDLWTWGLLTALAGQFLLFLGFACRWSSGRAATAVARAGRRGKADRAAAPAAASPAPSRAPLWSSRCEAALGLSLDALGGD